MPIKLFFGVKPIKGLAGLGDSPKSGRAVIDDEIFKDRILKKSDSPPDGYACWDAPLLAKELDSSVDAIWRLFKREGIYLSRQRSWCINTDKNFSAKAAGLFNAKTTATKTREDFIAYMERNCGGIW